MMIRFLMSLFIVSVLFAGFGCSKPRNAEAPKTPPASQGDQKRDDGQTGDNKENDKFKMDPRAAEFFNKAEDF